jgi:hypothetical protein
MTSADPSPSPEVLGGFVRAAGSDHIAGSGSNEAVQELEIHIVELMLVGSCTEVVDQWLQALFCSDQVSSGADERYDLIAALLERLWLLISEHVIERHGYGHPLARTVSAQFRRCPAITRWYGDERWIE